MLIHTMMVRTTWFPDGSIEWAMPVGSGWALTVLDRNGDLDLAYPTDAGCIPYVATVMEAERQAGRLNPL